jgi:hypothetical protein
MIPLELLNPVKIWASNNFFKFKKNGYGRQYGVLQELNPPNEVWEIKKQIEDFYNLKGVKQEPLFKDYCGYITEGGAIHPHIDQNENTLIHTRFNVLLSKPINGGEPIQNGNVIDVNEGEHWRCDAGKIEHWCNPVIGLKPRIVLSFGFLL